MQCPKCAHPRTADQLTCNGCGLVFHKYEARLRRREEGGPPAGTDTETLTDSLAVAAAVIWRSLMTPTKNMADLLPGFVILWLIFVLWGWSYMVQDITSLGHNPGFLHNINLPFHEAGHVIFGVFGKFIGSLGGTLGQLLIPAAAGIALLLKRGDTFGAGICLWWFGQNLLDIAPYMADARAGQLPLLGGNYGRSSPYGFHDWEFILGETGLLAHDQILAAVTMNLGRGIMLLAMLWGGRLLWLAWSGSRNGR